MRVLRFAATWLMVALGGACSDDDEAAAATPDGSASGGAGGGSSDGSSGSGALAGGSSAGSSGTAGDGSAGSGTGAGGTPNDAGGDAGPSSEKRCGPTPAATNQFYYVAPNGSDAANGASATPWGTITHAVNNVPDGATVLVRPGTYQGSVRLDRRFATGIVVRSEPPYAAKLRDNGVVVRSYTGRRITFEGFDVAHSGAGAGALVVQIQSTDMNNRTSQIVLRDNVIHDSFNNDIIKLNNGAEHVTIEGNVFYNQSGSDEHIDVNSVRDCVVQDNVFFNDFEGSGRSNADDTSAFVVIKDSNAESDGFLGAERITLRRNVFLRWQGNSNYGFIQVGEDGTANFEANDVTIENNLLIGNGTSAMRAPMAFQGVSNVTIRHNTVVGNFPGPASFGFTARLYTYGSNQPNQNIRFFNNIWSDSTGTMTRFSISPSGQTASFTLRHNLYWNGGSAIPSNGADLMNLASDGEALRGDPALGAQTDVVAPRLDGTRFADGSSSICEAFERLVSSYGTPGPTSQVLDGADSSQSPDHDVLVRPRPGGSQNDYGAVER